MEKGARGGEGEGETGDVARSLKLSALPRLIEGGATNWTHAAAVLYVYKGLAIDI